VGALRARLGLPRAGRFDDAVAREVADFQTAHGLAPTGRADAETIRALNRGPAFYERLIATNLSRARALPPTLGPRYVLVDAAGGQLWYFERGRPRLSMKVVVGRPDSQTPMMAGVIRHLIFNPYWNIPPDLVRTSVAPKVLSEGIGYADDLEVRPAYDERAPLLDPASLDWRAVQRGQRTVWVRQLPGPKNAMGQVKLMLPNPLGIYLHDTPSRELFAQEARVASAGCVRLEDAIGLARLLVGDRQVRRALQSGKAEHRVDLKQPVPVYITYFTAMPTADGMLFRPDIYGRDGRRTAELEGR
jgi:L,D-transpeptidase YcbB